MYAHMYELTYVSLSNMYPMFTNVLSFWISFVPSTTHRPAGNCCTRPPNTSLRNSILIRHGWMIGPKTSYKIDLVGHPIVFFVSRYTPLNLKFSLQPSHIGYFSLEYMPLKCDNPLCKHYAPSISIYIVSVSEFLCTYWESTCFRKTARWSWRQWYDLYIFWFFDEIISALFAKSDFIAYSQIFQVIMKLK